MARTKRHKPATRVGRSTVMLSAIQQSGGGKHRDKRKRTRAVDKRRAIQEAS